VRSGGRTSHAVIDSGGFLSVSAGGLVISTIVNSTGVGTSVGGSFYPAPPAAAPRAPPW
jgi:autotransporter passenger strand-loop-strand repeat protein